MGVVSVFLSVLASFRGTVQHGLPLEIGDTVQILEKCEGTVSQELFYRRSTSQQGGGAHASRLTSCLRRSRNNPSSGMPLMERRPFVPMWNVKN